MTGGITGGVGDLETGLALAGGVDTTVCCRVAEGSSTPLADLTAAAGPLAGGFPTPERGTAGGGSLCEEIGPFVALDDVEITDLSFTTAVEGKAGISTCGGGPVFFEVATVPGWGMLLKANDAVLGSALAGTAGAPVTSWKEILMLQNFKY